MAAAGLLFTGCVSARPAPSAPVATATVAPTFTPLQFQRTPSPPPPTPVPTAAPSAPAVPSPSVAPGSVRYLAIGASDAVGVGATDPVRGSWPALLSARFARGTSYLNLGVSGSLARDAFIAQVPRASAANPTVVTIWLAVNDLNAGVTPAAFQGDIGRIVDALLVAPQVRLFIGNVPDLTAVPAYANTDKTALRIAANQYNAIIASLTSRAPNRVTIVDLFSGSAEFVSSGTVAGDGFHPSDAGYRLIADRFATAMRLAGQPIS